MLSVTFIGECFLENCSICEDRFPCWHCMHPNINAEAQNQSNKRAYANTSTPHSPFYCLFCLVPLKTKIILNSMFNCQRNSNSRAHTQGSSETVSSRLAQQQTLIYIYMTSLPKNLNQGLPNKLAHTNMIQVQAYTWNNSVFSGILSKN